MKRLLALPLAAALLLCGGCDGGGIYANYRDIERLRPIETLGLDLEDGEILLSAAGPDTAGSGPLALMRQGPDIEGALAALEGDFPEGEPYYAHVHYFLLGAEAAESDIRPWLDYIARSPELLLDTTLFVCRGRAASMVLGATGEKSGVTERLNSLKTGLETLGQGRLYSARQLASALADRGAAVCGAVEASDVGDRVKNAEAFAVLPAGAAVFKEGRLAGWIEQEDIPGLLLFEGGPDGARVHLEAAGSAVSLRLDSGSASAKPPKDGRVAVDVHLEASLAELDTGAATDVDALNQALAEQTAAWVETLLALEQTLDCDFLGICSGQSPAALTFSVTVEATVLRSYDLREGGGIA